MDRPRRPLANRLLLVALPGAALVNAGLFSARLAQLLWAAFLTIEAAVWLGRRLAARFARPAGVPVTAAGGGPSLPPAAAAPGPFWLTVLAAALALFGLASGFRLPGPPVVPVLTYHRVATPPRRRYPVPTVAPAEFAREIDWLKSRGYRCVSPGYLLAPGRVAGRPLVITFDDGWRDNLAAAAVLRQRGFSGVIFVVTGSIGRPLALTAAQLRALDREGFTIAAHTVTHPHLDRLSRPARLAELRQSRLQLQRLLGHRVDYFAYPYGSTDLSPDSGRLIQEAGYRLAFASHAFGLNVNFLYPGAVRRIVVSRNPLLARVELTLLLW
ncbi:MAG: polysaccharide deacetylase family protein [Chitinophagales bacterium]